MKVSTASFRNAGWALSALLVVATPVYAAPAKRPMAKAANAPKAEAGQCINESSGNENVNNKLTPPTEDQMAGLRQMTSEQFRLPWAPFLFSEQPDYSQSPQTQQ